MILIIFVQIIMFVCLLGALSFIVSRPSGSSSASNYFSLLLFGARLGPTI